MKKIQEVIETDAKHRTTGETGDLHSIESLVSGKSLDYDVSTLVNKDFEYHQTTNLVH